MLGKTAGEAAVQLCKDQDVAKVTGTAPFTTPGRHRRVTSILLDAAADHQGQPRTSSSTPAGSTKDNVCKGVAAGSVQPAADNLTTSADVPPVRESDGGTFARRSRQSAIR